MREVNIIYYQTIEDIQDVALEVLDRKLTEEEVDKVSDRVGDHIHWYDAVEYSIYDVIPSEKNEL